MTGGICLPVSKKQPQILERMRKAVSKLNIVILIGVLPFTMISLLLGNMLSEHQSLLSVAFMCAMSIAATSLPQFMFVIMRIFYSHKMNAAITARDPSVVRSIESLDKLSSADYIFMLDGCAVTDGLLHLESVQGNWKTLSQSNPMM
jgi:magnesium-transporting ATPase (P-type)